jgi:hypothetical protein
MPMTEAEWLASTDPEPMLAFLRRKASERKLRLFAVACCRRIWHLIPEEVGRRAVELAEEYAAGMLAEEALSGVRAQSNPVTHRRYDKKRELGMTRAGYAQAAAWASVGPSSAARSAELVLGYLAGAVAARRPEKRAQGTLLRDIFGNPFRPPRPLPPTVLAWNRGRVRLLAQAIYDERQLPEGTLDAARLAILADAMLDAGCEDEELMQHCRSEGPHVRGCWAVDLILGKS